MTIQESIENLRIKLKDRNVSKVARNIGISYDTIYVFAKLNKNIRLDNLILIERYLNEESKVLDK